MIDRIFYGSEAPNPYNVRAAEYTVSTNTVRNVTGIQTNSWCSAGAAFYGGQVINFGGGEGLSDFCSVRGSCSKCTWASRSPHVAQ